MKSTMWSVKVDCQRWTIALSITIDWEIYYNSCKTADSCTVHSQNAVYGSIAARNNALRNTGSIRIATQSAERYRIHGLRHSKGESSDNRVQSESLYHKIGNFQGTVIITALGAASHDTSIWEKPHQFKPERFLDDNGKLSLKNDLSLPFGAGKRLCAGETFARNMLFLFVSAFFQAFSVSPPVGEKIHKFDDNFTGLIRNPPDHWIQLHAR